MDLVKNSSSNKIKTDLKSKNIDSSKIEEDKAGNCIVAGKRIEANACSLIKDNYKKR